MKTRVTTRTMTITEPRAEALEEIITPITFRTEAATMAAADQALILALEEIIVQAQATAAVQPMAVQQA